MRMIDVYLSSRVDYAREERRLLLALLEGGSEAVPRSTPHEESMSIFSPSAPGPACALVVCT